MPVYQTQAVEVGARTYNLWRRCRSHKHLPRRFSLQGLRGLVMVVDTTEWLCADETQADLPVLCWTNFMDAQRDSLHTPVECTLNYYHYAAHLIADEVLEKMAGELAERLSATTRI